RHPVRTVRSAVDQRLQLHPRDLAVALDPGLKTHQDWMTPAVAIKDFLPRQTNLDWAVEYERGFRDNNFVMEGITLATEASAVRRGNHANVGGRHFQNLGERTVQIVRRLRAAPDRELSVGVLRRDRSVLFDRKVRASLVEENVLEDLVRLGKRLLNVPELKRYPLVNVSFVAVVVN